MSYSTRRAEVAVSLATLKGLEHCASYLSSSIKKPHMVIISKPSKTTIPFSTTITKRIIHYHEKIDEKTLPRKLKSLLQKTPKELPKSYTTTIKVSIPQNYLVKIDELVETGIYPSRSEAIRMAIRDLLMKASKELKPAAIAIINERLQSIDKTEKIIVNIGEAFNKEVIEAIDKGKKAEELFPKIKDDPEFYEFLANRMMKKIEAPMDEKFREKLKEWLKVLAYIVVKNAELLPTI